MNIPFLPDSIPGPFSEEALDDLVRLLRNDLPELEIDSNYIEFSRQHNGGRPANLRFKTSDNNQWTVNVFLHFCDSQELNATDLHHHILEFLDNAEDQLPTPALWPIGIVSGGNFLCFDHTKHVKEPEVIIFLLESHTTLFVADSFQAFLTLCAESSRALE